MVNFHKSVGAEDITKHMAQSALTLVLDSIAAACDGEYSIKYNKHHLQVVAALE